MTSWARPQAPSLVSRRLMQVFGGGVADGEGLGDLGVGQAAGHEREDLSFPFGDLVQGGRRSSARTALGLMADFCY